MSEHILDGTIDDADNAINVLKTIEEINSFREYEKENKDRDGIYDLLDSREEDLTETEEIQTEVVTPETIVVEHGDTGLPETIETEGYDSMKSKIEKLKPEQLKNLNPDILKKYNIKIN